MHATRRNRADWRGIGWFLLAALVAIGLGYAADAATGVLGGLVVLLVGVALT
jgi:hypothetical protein